jgi:hypothetical protein
LGERQVPAGAAAPLASRWSDPLQWIHSMGSLRSPIRNIIQSL